MESKKLYRYEEAGRQQGGKVIRGTFGEGARTAPRHMEKEPPARRVRRKKAMQRRIVNAITEVLSFIAVLLFLLTISWAFWICGDAVPDKVDAFPWAAGFVLAAIALLFLPTLSH